jgi:hypothetical protein
MDSHANPLSIIAERDATAAKRRAAIERELREIELFEAETRGMRAMATAMTSASASAVASAPAAATMVVGVNAPTSASLSRQAYTAIGVEATSLAHPVWRSAGAINMAATTETVSSASHQGGRPAGAVSKVTREILFHLHEAFPRPGRGFFEQNLINAAPAFGLAPMRLKDAKDRLAFFGLLGFVDQDSDGGYHVTDQAMAKFASWGWKPRQHKAPNADASGLHESSPEGETGASSPDQAESGFTAENGAQRSP